MEQHPTYKAEIDWQELLRQPWRLFGYSYIYLTVCLIGIGWLYLGHVTTIGQNDVPSVFSEDSTANIVDVPLRSPRALPPVNVLAAGVSSPESISRGKDLYTTQCASCHGEGGLGDGPAGIVLNPKPRNFSLIEGWTNGSTVSGIYKTLEEGIVKNGMASYSYLPPGDRFALAHYVRTFAQNQPEDSEEDLQLLERTYALSEGVNVSGQIPIQRATFLVLSEHQALSDAVDEAVRTGQNEIFRRVAKDPIRAMTTLSILRARSASVEDVTRMISKDPLQAGFVTGVTRLSGSEWSRLYQVAPVVR